MAKLTSTITCPSCAHAAVETMPTDACQYLYACRQCGHEMKPKRGDCCVYCSYGDTPCPPIQDERGCGSAPEVPTKERAGIAGPASCCGPDGG